MLDPHTIAALARQLYEARKTRTPLRHFSAAHPGMTVEDGAKVFVEDWKGFAAQKKPAPWVRIYRLPRQVYFSHEVHAKKAKVDCAICHGPVAERDALSQEKSIAMADCMACHDRYKASNDCNLCHDSH